MADCKTCGGWAFDRNATDKLRPCPSCGVTGIEPGTSKEGGPAPLADPAGLPEQRG